MSESMWKAAAQQCSKDRQALYERIAALEAELARLKPSGQVAEDELLVRAAVDASRMPGFDAAEDGARDALSRLAAMAQGYEDAVADNAALLEWIDQHGHAEWCQRLGEKSVSCTPGCLAFPLFCVPHAHPGAALLEQHRKEVEAFTARLAALREHAQMLYECAPSTNSRTSREQVEQWEKAKRTHHEVMAEPDAGAELLTELNDHRRNIQVLRDELGAKDDEHVVDAFHRWEGRLTTVVKKLAAYIRTRAGHEENCRGWHKPVKDKSAPGWKRRGEWMDLERCSCGPGELLRLASEATS